MLFAGYQYDAESGMYHVRHRNYHPMMGRWVQRDPFEQNKAGGGYQDGMSLYQSMSSNPVLLIDFDGLFSRRPKLGQACCMQWQDMWEAAGYSSHWSCIGDCMADFNHWAQGVAAGVLAPIGVKIGAPLALPIPCYTLGTFTGCSIGCEFDVCVAVGTWKLKVGGTPKRRTVRIVCE